MESHELDKIERTLDAIHDRFNAFRVNLQMGECPACGAFRLDGRPPLIHDHGCPYQEDAPWLYFPDGTPLTRS